MFRFDSGLRRKFWHHLPFTLPTPEAFGDYVKSEIKKYAKVIADAGIQAVA